MKNSGRGACISCHAESEAEDRKAGAEQQMQELKADRWQMSLQLQGRNLLFSSLLLQSSNNKAELATFEQTLSYSIDVS
jgi:hypothetical protein